MERSDFRAKVAAYAELASCASSVHVSHQPSAVDHAPGILVGIIGTPDYSRVFVATDSPDCDEFFSEAHPLSINMPGESLCLDQNFTLGTMFGRVSVGAELE